MSIDPNNRFDLLEITPTSDPSQLDENIQNLTNNTFLFLNNRYEILTEKLFLRLFIDFRPILHSMGYLEAFYHIAKTLPQGFYRDDTLFILAAGLDEEKLIEIMRDFSKFCAPEVSFKEELFNLLTEINSYFIRNVTLQKEFVNHMYKKDESFRYIDEL